VLSRHLRCTLDNRTRIALALIGPVICPSPCVALAGSAGRQRRRYLGDEFDAGLIRYRI
jgi:hypothetical protein